MKDSRILKMVLKYNPKYECKRRLKDVVEVTKILYLPPPDGSFIYDLDTKQSALMALSRVLWWRVLEEKPKLKSYAVFRNRQDSCAIVPSNLERQQKSLVSKLVCGIFPLAIQVQ